MTKTVLEELVEGIEKFVADNELNELYRAGLLACASQIKLTFNKEKLQIESAWWAGHDERDAAGVIHVSELAATEYFDRTYKSE